MNAEIQDDEAQVDADAGVRFTARVELVATVVLALAAICTAWAGFQSAKWSGVQANSYASAGASRTEATRFSTLAGQQAQVDIGTYMNWLVALEDDLRTGFVELPSEEADYQADPSTLSGFLFARLRPEFVPAVEAWLSSNPLSTPDAPATPFELEEYELGARTRAEELRSQADSLGATARAANQTSDDYVLTAVMFALVLFFGSVAGRLRTKLGSVLTLFVGAIVFGASLARLLSLPIEL